jgi:hypothetical protein
VHHRLRECVSVQAGSPDTIWHFLQCTHNLILIPIDAQGWWLHQVAGARVLSSFNIHPESHRHR